MNQPDLRYRIFPLGDYAVTIDFGNVISEPLNKRVLTLFRQLSKDPLPGMIEVVPAYSSLTVYYDLFATRKSLTGEKSSFEFICHKLEERLAEPFTLTDELSRSIDIPVCYGGEFGPDLEDLAKQKNITAEELIRIHHSMPYRVYMLGFLPGFSYMGEVDERISADRKIQPAIVAAGSVGIAGRQTGIYPFSSPGGWQIIGRTPLRLFDAEKEEPGLLQAGDTVRFISISQNEFENY